MNDFPSDELRRLLDAAIVEQVRELGLSESDIVGLAQAYLRGIGRIVAAETNVTARARAQVAPEQRAQWTERWIRQLVPLAAPTFEAIHERLLSSSIAALETTSGEPDSGSRAVAFVDLRGSTAFMLRSSRNQIRELVDGVFLASQQVTRAHKVAASKHLGDGVLLVGADRAETLTAATELTAALQRVTPLRAAGGVDFGEVTTRAGDHFGPPVNLAARLAEAAPAGGVLVGAAAVPEPAPMGTWDVRSVRGLDEPQRVLLITV